MLCAAPCNQRYGNGVDTGDTYAIDASAVFNAGTVADGEYILIRGDWSADVFTVDTGADSDTLALYDNDHTGGVATSDFVVNGTIEGCATGDLETPSNHITFIA